MFQGDLVGFVVPPVPPFFFITWINLQSSLLCVLFQVHSVMGIQFLPAALMLLYGLLVIFLPRTATD